MALEHESDSALAIAVRAVGSQSAFGRLLGKRQSVVFGWLRDARPLPAEHVLKVEQATGVSRHDLRPDIYPRDDAAPSSSTPGPTHHPRSFGSYPGTAPAAESPSAVGATSGAGNRP
ncbi:YdaS family helix-turn-helix protein [Novosphingobium sp. EMRT-2]|uniref:transcriptional regulator n=1 Tax=Novosphingobium sp. EMRT-2 TaxID=2571749 RepID=UPI0010BD7015|nr:YdaS family helix-turn-helix protein [Novosphingobium sp. EMRT-2]QCI92292.1 helix-turn-helix domain-containing protein [Novosphingobium sp. EMRT-2]